MKTNDGTKDLCWTTPALLNRKNKQKKIWMKQKNRKRYGWNRKRYGWNRKTEKDTDETEKQKKIRTENRTEKDTNEAIRSRDHFERSKVGTK